ncbi:electron transfer flavoprotein subunit alpha/FixB family protein [Silvibacterium dinghuense]|uniref:Electron transfer flavoprotein subunit alpha/FixB family protein n=1 Tax=Silvibacterium dinghuense TaxID=1560006 RepID=A0A4Q1SI94_9BACT|nr:electron transfer flavoprotein subunit alpha/FixB family protein [Silvibacterium dinghuense]RXS97328.1 electron transfer flavoprotein subunit alpha/FixB family protein [Silvibacterium dinghuense]GGG98092.1 electron transfer flavoprotein subunit alpha [Silvibacterium dinghuense]
MILIVAEHSNGKLARVTREMVNCARGLGREASIAILVLGKGVAAVANEAAQLAEQVLVADSDHLAVHDAELWAAAVAQIAKEGDAHTVLVSAGRGGRAWSPRVAVKLEAPLLEDVTSLRYEDSGYVATRFTYLARVTETVRAEAAVVVASVKPGAFDPAPFDSAALSSAGEQFDVDLDLPQRRVEVTGRSAEKLSRVSLAEAEIVVSGGRGVGTAEGFTALVEGLADRLGAAVGATRAVVDAGWRPYAEQVGQTGKTVQPKLYIAVGISGAVQHLSGMSKSRTIVAINKDGEAPIFKIADYGIVGDVQQVVPALIERLKQ